MSLAVQAARKFLAREIRRQATGRRRVFASDVRRLTQSLDELEKANAILGKRHPRFLEMDMDSAMRAEADVAKYMKRIGLERKRSAEFLSRFRSATGGGTEEAKALRRAFRQPGGTFRLQSVPAGRREIQEGTARFQGFPYARGRLGGEVTMAPTRHAGHDAWILAHELGHGAEYLSRALPPKEAAFRRVMERLRSYAQPRAPEMVPYRAPGSPMRQAIEMHALQRRRGRTLSPRGMERALSEPERLPEELRRRLAAQVKPHSPEEPVADLFAALVSPELRKTLPFEIRAELARMFPQAFPEMAARARRSFPPS